MGKGRLHRNDRVKAQAGVVRDIPERSQPPMMEVVRCSRSHQVSGDDGLETGGTMNCQVPRIPAGPLRLGKPLVQVKPTPGKPVPVFNGNPVGAPDYDQLVPSRGRR
jgi:hypothetical protein